MMDEKLIAEVQQHAIIYNRQKSNTINGDKCITKELAWQDIARNLGTDSKCARLHTQYATHVSVIRQKKNWKYVTNAVIFYCIFFS